MTRCAVGMRITNEHQVEQSARRAQSPHPAGVWEITASTSSSLPLPHSTMAPQLGGNAAMNPCRSEREHRSHLDDSHCKVRMVEGSLTTQDVICQIDDHSREREPRKVSTSFPFAEHCAMQLNCGGWIEGCAIRRQETAWRRVASFAAAKEEFGSHAFRFKASHAYRRACPATTCCVHDSSSSTCSCPAMPLHCGLADAFPPRSPGGRRSARGFSPSLSGDGNRGGNTHSGDTVASGGTARRQLLVGERAASEMRCSLALEAGVRADTWPAFDRTSKCGMGLNPCSLPNESGVLEKGDPSIREGVSGESAQAA